LNPEKGVTTLAKFVGKFKEREKKYITRKVEYRGESADVEEGDKKPSGGETFKRNLRLMKGKQHQTPRRRKEEKKTLTPIGSLGKPLFNADKKTASNPYTSNPTQDKQ